MGTPRFEAEAGAPAYRQCPRWKQAHAQATPKLCSGWPLREFRLLLAWPRRWFVAKQIVFGSFAFAAGPPTPPHDASHSATPGLAFVGIPYTPPERTSASRHTQSLRLCWLPWLPPEALSPSAQAAAMAAMSADRVVKYIAVARLSDHVIACSHVQQADPTVNYDDRVEAVLKRGKWGSVSSHLLIHVSRARVCHATGLRRGIQQACVAAGHGISASRLGSRLGQSDVPAAVAPFRASRRGLTCPGRRPLHPHIGDFCSAGMLLAPRAGGVATAAAYRTRDLTCRLAGRLQRDSPGHRRGQACLLLHHVKQLPPALCGAVGLGRQRQADSAR